MRLTDDKLASVIAQLQADYDLMISQGAAMDDAHGEQFLHLTDQLHILWQALDSLQALRRTRQTIETDANFRDASHK
ncbi:hypothetical protein ACO0LD_05305 [Undibacterium sp. Ji83W]|uniref:hypothetical protein n=1 Tax=Undibacterium sp. Ji83W TaxID=3413043 RepID=UPI003BF038D0